MGLVNTHFLSQMEEEGKRSSCVKGIDSPERS